MMGYDIVHIYTQVISLHDSWSAVGSYCLPHSRHYRHLLLQASQGLDISHLLGSLRGQHQGKVLLDAHAILDPYAHAAKVRGKSLIVGDVHARLDGDAVPRTEGDVAPVAGTVVHVEADVVADVVREEGVEGVGAGHVEAEAGELRFERGLGHVVDAVQGHAAAGAAQGDPSALDAQDGLVEVSLGRGELAPGRPGACDVGDVGSVLAAGVDEDQLVWVQAGIVQGVVDEAGTGPAGHDGDVGWAAAAVLGEGVVEVGGEILLVGPGAAHGVGDGPPGYPAGVAHVGEFGAGLDDAEVVDEGP